MLALYILIASLLALLVLYGYLVCKTYKNIQENFEIFVSSPGKDENGNPLPSPVGQFTDAIATQCARAIVAQAKTTFMANESARVRGEKAIEGDIAEDMLTATNPLLAGILNQFPTVKKSLRKNPGLAGIVLEKVMPMLAGNKGNNHSQESSQVKFKL